MRKFTYMNYPSKPLVFLYSILSIIFSIIGITFAILLLLHTETITKTYDIIFNSDKENANFLNVALSNLVPAHFFADLKCTFTRSTVTSDKQGLNFGASIKKLKDNRIIENTYKTYSEDEIYFPPNSLTSSKFTLVSFPTDKIDTVKLQLSFIKPFGSLDRMNAEYSFLSGSEPGIIRPITCSFSFLILLSMFSYLQNIQNVSISDFYCCFLAFLGFISLNPFLLIQNYSKYTSFDFFSMPLFNTYLKYYIILQIFELCQTIDKKTHMALFIFFILLFTIDSLQGMLKIIQIKNSSKVRVPVSIIDIIYIALNSIYIVYACRLFNRFFNNNLINFLLVVNIEQISFSLISIILTIRGYSLSMNGKAILTFVNLLIASICILVMRKRKNMRHRLMDDDEEPLFSSNSNIN